MNYQILNFWEYLTAIANVSSLAPGHVYTPHRPTLGFKEVISQVTCWAPPWNSISLVSVIPEISNDAQNWEKLGALTVGPLTTPGTTIFKQDTVAAYQRFDIEIGTAVPIPLSADSGISLLIQSIARGGKSQSTGRGGNFDEYVKYYDALRRGENWGGAPGGGQLLEFFPRQLVITSDNGTGQWQTIYTRPVSTQECDQVDVSLSVDSMLDSSGMGMVQMAVYPEISIDGIHWYELWADGFTTITPGTTFPFLEHKKLSTIGAFMRLSISFMDPMGMMASMGATIELMGCGRG